MEREKKLQEAEKMLRDAGYHISRGLTVNLSLAEAACGGDKCTAGCYAGCTTCSPGNSNPKVFSLHPTFQFPREGIFEELVTISEGTTKK